MEVNPSSKAPEADVPHVCAVAAAAAEAVNTEKRRHVS